MATTTPELIGGDQAMFLGGGVGMSVATCRPGALPNIARATGLRISADRRVVTILLAATPSAATLDDVRRTGAIALVCSQPSTHRTIQLKGSDARIVPVEVDDEALVARCVDAFAAELVSLGYSDVIFRALLSCEAEDLTAVQFTIDAAFSQTPGPRAGEPLASSA